MTKDSSAASPVQGRALPKQYQQAYGKIENLSVPDLTVSNPKETFEFAFSEINPINGNPRYGVFYITATKDNCFAQAMAVIVATAAMHGHPVWISWDIGPGVGGEAKMVSLAGLSPAAPKS